MRGPALIAAAVKNVEFEPTGPCHRAVDAAGLPIAKVFPRQARRCTEAARKLVKTDRSAPCQSRWKKTTPLYVHVIAILGFVSAFHMQFCLACPLV